MAALDLLHTWPVDHAAAVLLHGDRPVEWYGDPDRVFRLASVTKLATAMAVLVAHEEGTVDLDAPVTDAGASVADLLAHAGGIAPDEPRQLTPPHRRRIYSSAAYEMAATAVATAAGMDFRDYLREAVFGPLAMTSTVLKGPAGWGAKGSARDVASLMVAWRSPVLIDSTTLGRARTPHLPALAGVLPGYGRQDPNPWGLGPEIRGAKAPHWTAADNSPQTWGHFGRSGTMAWTDPDADRTLVVLTDREFGAWAVEAWPMISAAALGPA